MTSFTRLLINTPGFVQFLGILIPKNRKNLFYKFSIEKVLLYSVFGASVVDIYGVSAEPGIKYD